MLSTTTKTRTCHFVPHPFLPNAQIPQQSLLRLCHRLRWRFAAALGPKLSSSGLGKQTPKILNLRLGMKLALMGRRQFTQWSIG
ncbi:hypothetical protein Pyn_01732 [Prunus yedoensis var. nudiflora]|uniref:Uncharacterized protein n=1 Tax=Prunus yedoensis var. nudiflora TaxID=2094558 RepID=A0A314U7F7_PRUYE|nr:hypothetical protein Pyn_01732 [Prunus yedoensis var. nudiflora]